MVFFFIGHLTSGWLWVPSPAPKVEISHSSKFLLCIHLSTLPLIMSSGEMNTCVIILRRSLVVPQLKKKKVVKSDLKKRINMIYLFFSYQQTSMVVMSTSGPGPLMAG